MLPVNGVLPFAISCHCEPVTDVTGVAIRVQPGALHSAAGLRPAGSISVSPVLLFQIKACALIWRGRRKERICSFRGAYSNRGNGMQRVSSDVGGCGLPHQRARWFAMTYFWRGASFCAFPQFLFIAKAILNSRHSREFSVTKKKSRRTGRRGRRPLRNGHAEFAATNRRAMECEYIKREPA